MITIHVSWGARHYTDSQQSVLRGLQAKPYAKIIPRMHNDTVARDASALLNIVSVLRLHRISLSVRNYHPDSDDQSH